MKKATIFLASITQAQRGGSNV